MKSIKLILIVKNLTFLDNSKLILIEYLFYKGATVNESLLILQTDDGWNSYFCQRKFSKPSDPVADNVSNRMELATKFTLYKYNSAEPFQVVFNILGQT